MKHFLLTVFLLSSATLLSAASVKGVVKDKVTGEELIGATIIWKEEPAKGTLTGLDGSFRLDLPSERGALVCSYLGYLTAEFPIEEAHPDLLILLQPLCHEISEVVVYAPTTGDTEIGVRNMEKLSPAVMNVVSAKAIEISPDITVANVIQRISGVTIERNSSGDGQYAVLRGMDKRYNYTLINGVKIPSPDNKNRFVPLDIFPSELLDRLEVTKSLTASMEGDAIGGAVNLVMKEAPQDRRITANLSTGYNALFLERDFYSFDVQAINKQSPYEIYGKTYPAKVRDFSEKSLRLKASNPSPNLLGGFSYGNRLINNRLGIMLAGSYQNSYRGSNSVYYGTSTATSDASNLPILIDKNDRTYSEQQTRYGLHAQLDYRFSLRHKLQWYNAYMDFTNTQVRDNHKIDLNIGYNPLQGAYNLSFDTRFRVNRQEIGNSTLKGAHSFASDALQMNWSAVYSKAFNETPDNTSVHTVTTVRNRMQNPISVVTLGGADRRWEHNTDEDWAGYFNLVYSVPLEKIKLDFSAGGLYRNKQRTNFFNQYDFRPYDETKQEGTRNNLLKGVDWNDYSEIKFTVFTPFGSVGNPLNYDASEEITATYGQLKMGISKLQFIAGLRLEKTDQGYHLKYPIDGVKNIGSQVYTDYLTDLHLKYTPWENNNIRLSYYQSLNRPSFFEIVPYRIINEDFTEMGNPELKHTVAHNLDVRYEYFPRPSEQIMLGLFYKKLKDPIEYGMITQGQGTFYMPANFGDADNYGMEIDITKYFYAFGVKANYTFTQSEITTTKLVNYDNPDAASSEKVLVKNVNQTRPLNGQAKQVLNLSLLYKDMKNGWDGQLAFSYTGDRLYAVSRYLDNDIWQGGYLQLDASLEKKFKKGLSLFLKATNLLDTPMILYLKKQNASNNAIEGYENYKNGTLVRRDYYGQNLQIGGRYRF
ncbi:MAG: TonB-dependent receptor [Dysgonamonadaceae bacterium]|jgi:TonB-dependent receptor|nr:TonB-dependent receptor [Dysgonamonadaceae bacterium]